MCAFLNIGEKSPDYYKQLKSFDSITSSASNASDGIIKIVNSFCDTDKIREIIVLWTFFRKCDVSINQSIFLNVKL